MGRAVPRFPVVSHSIRTAPLKSTFLKGAKHREQNRVGLLRSTQLVQGLEGEIGVTCSGPAVFIDLETV
jgi:hypothetical protein